MLTPRITPQHVLEVIFKYSIYASSISGLCYPAEPPPPSPLPHEEVCRWPGWRPTAICAKANSVAAP